MSREAHGTFAGPPQVGPPLQDLDVSKRPHSPHHERSAQLTEGVNLVVLWAFACGVGLGYLLGVTL